MNPDLVAFAAAVEFAARAHRDQRRKGEAGEPYFNHLAEVAGLVAAATQGRQPEAVIAAILHDTVEDTHVTHAQLIEVFGDRVAAIVAEVTDDKALPKAERKRLQVESSLHKSDAAKLIKIADKTSNLRALITTPPRSWDLARKQEYYDWAAAVVAGCRGVNAALEAAFDQAFAARHQLTEKEPGCKDP